MRTRFLGIVLAVAVILGMAVVVWRRPARPEDGEKKEKTTVAVYFARELRGERQLVKVERELPPSTEQMMYAAVALVKGPTEQERAAGLRPVLPASTKVLSLRREGDTVFVDLSKEVLFNAAAELGVSSTTEALALGALANTFTEFPGVEKVRIFVEGKSKGQVDGWYVEDFWGHIGIREPLRRNTVLMEGNAPPTRSEPVQTVGEPTDGLALKDIRWSADAERFRLVFDIVSREGEPAPVIPFTRTEYAASARVIRIQINAMRGTFVTELKPSRRLEFTDERAATLTWDVYEDDQAFAFSLALRPTGEYDYRLSGLRDPVRIVLDVWRR